jgi:hypothetical protein
MAAPVVKPDPPEYLQVVYSEVYAPNRLDAHDEYMTADEIRKMAWRFMGADKTRSIDMMHDNILIEAQVVESFIAQAGDPTFIEGAWVVGVHIADPDVWQKILNKELNGFSMEAYVIREQQEIEIDHPIMATGTTSEDDGHVHNWYVRFDETGKFLGGETDVVDGHFHLIIAGTITEVAEEHIHRFATVDELAIIPEIILA